MENRTQKIGEILIGKGLIGDQELKEALDAQKKDKRKLGEILVSKGFITEEKLAKTLADIFEVPFVRIADITLDDAAVKLIPRELIEQYRIYPISVDGQALTVATVDPLNINVFQELQYKSGYFFRPVMVTHRDLEECFKGLESAIHTAAAVRAMKGETDDNVSIGNLVKSIISRAIKERASDIHFEPEKERLRVRFRIDGVLHERKSIPTQLARNVLSRVKILGGMDVAESRRPQDGRIAFVLDEVEFDIRVSSLPDIRGENLVLRILSKSFVNMTFEHLGMDPAEKDVMQRLTLKPYGLILLTGPTGSGKTTTLYSMLNVLNNSERKIISVEDPVEYEVSGVTQTAVNRHIGYTFSTAIRQMLRHDPDVIMVGEIRDQETADMAIRAALTGHVVLSTIHTNSAVGAITRLIEMEIEPFLISSALNGVIAQRLVRQICPHCGQEVQAEEDEVEELKKFVDVKAPLKIMRPKGCSKCLDAGYIGREGVYEILEIDKEIRKMIIKGANEHDIVAHAKENGMNLLIEAGAKKVIDKKTTIPELLRIISIS